MRKSKKNWNKTNQISRQLLLSEATTMQTIHELCCCCCDSQHSLVLSRSFSLFHFVSVRFFHLSFLNSVELAQRERKTQPIRSVFCWRISSTRTPNVCLYGLNLQFSVLLVNHSMCINFSAALQLSHKSIHKAIIATMMRRFFFWEKNF